MEKFNVDCIEVPRKNGFYEVILTGQGLANMRRHFLMHVDYQNMMFCYGYPKSYGMLYIEDDELDLLIENYIDLFFDEEGKEQYEKGEG